MREYGEAARKTHGRWAGQLLAVHRLGSIAELAKLNGDSSLPTPPTRPVIEMGRRGEPPPTAGGIGRPNFTVDLTSGADLIGLRKLVPRPIALLLPSIVDMSLPKILAQVFFVGSQIVGKAFMEAGRQAVRNIRATPEAAAAGGAATGPGSKAGGVSGELTRAHRMTTDEAMLILNFKQENAAKLPSPEELEKMVQVSYAPDFLALLVLTPASTQTYERLFKINAPPAPKGRQGGGQGSFYIQSKIVRARERLEAEWDALRKQANPPPPADGAQAPPSA